MDTRIVSGRRSPRWAIRQLGEQHRHVRHGLAVLASPLRGCDRRAKNEREGGKAASQQYEASHIPRWYVGGFLEWAASYLALHNLGQLRIRVCSFWMGLSRWTSSPTTDATLPPRTSRRSFQKFGFPCVDVVVTSSGAPLRTSGSVPVFVSVVPRVVDGNTKMATA